jgi:predicted MPP superfamily phosphohydrolase
MLAAWLVAAAVGLAAQQPPAAPPAAGAPAAAAPAGRPQGAGPGGGRGQGPLAVPPGGFFFIQLSDTQFGFSNNDVDFIQDTVNAEFAVATVNRLAPAFVVVTGDLVNKPGDAAQIAEYRRILGKLDPSIPLYNISGNHDIENEPTPAAIAAYRTIFGPDYFTFQHASLFGIVLNSTLIHSPQNAQAELAEQDAWLRSALEKAKQSGAKHVVVFQHHPWFLEKADEPDQYFNIPLARRTPLLELFRANGIRYLISGHLHRSTEATDAGVSSIVTGPVGRPLGGQSGFRVFVVTDTEITSRYYGFGEMPYRIGPPSGRGR